MLETRTARLKLSVRAKPYWVTVAPGISLGYRAGPGSWNVRGALLEEIVYDENGQNRSGSFADYLLATAVEIPPIEVIGLDRPNRKTPTGSKGMAEGGVMGSIGVLMSAVNDALQPFGVVADRQPLTPQYIRALLRSKT
jgi:aerobic carbon-monoxide dehydrogenase large subunit